MKEFVLCEVMEKNSTVRTHALVNFSLSPRLEICGLSLGLGGSSFFL